VLCDAVGVYYNGTVLLIGSAVSLDGSSSYCVPDCCWRYV